MSGIVGLVAPSGASIDREVLRAMLAAVTFRGPDRQEIWTGAQVGFGQALLHTTAAFAPPFVNVDDPVWVVADARIDGREALVESLERRGVVVAATASDAACVLGAYQAWGVDCAAHLLGDFAFGIWDRRASRLLLVRDQLGVKPLFYATDHQGIAFSNTLAALRRVPAVAGALNERAIADYLLFGHNPEHDTTSFARIRRLPPAHSLTWTPDGVSVRRYWTLPVREPVFYTRREDYVDQFRSLLHTAVTDRLCSTRTTVSLSGGLDSSLVAVAAHDALAQAGRPSDLAASTAVFERTMEDPEKPHAASVAAALGIPIAYHAADAYPLFERRPLRAFRTPEPAPLAGLAAHVARLQHVADRSRVMLTGQGGDVLLRPSASHLFATLRSVRLGRLAGDHWRHLRTYGRLPRLGMRTRLRRWADRPLQSTASFPRWLSPDLIRDLDLEARWQEVRQRRSALPEHHRPEAYAVAASPDWGRRFEAYDPGRTGVALDVRHPLFDLRLVDFALTIPTLPWCPDKALMRELLRGRIPDSVRLRPKTPLGENPADTKMERGDMSWLLDMPVSPELSRYVRGAAAASPESTRSLRDLRPFFLNAWLHSLDGDLVVDELPKEETVDAFTTR
jgi:asparagine synthase (glutamine-hydrolysing)